MADAMFTALDDAQGNDALAKIGRKFAPYADRLAEFQALEQEQAAAKAQPEPPPEPQSAFAWEAPEYDPRWETWVEPDGRGGYKAPDAAPELASIAAKLTKHRTFMADKITEFLGNPQELIHGAMAGQIAEMEKRITESSQKAITDAIQKQVETAEMQAYIGKQEKDLYQHNAEGEPLCSTKGEPVLTPKGAKMAEYADMLSTAGITDQSAMRDVLTKLLAADEATGQFGTPTQPTPQSATIPPVVPTKRKFLDRIRGNSKGGTVPDPTAPTGSQQQNPNASFEDIARRIAQEQGVAL
jgi:hypothetical protein